MPAPPPQFRMPQRASTQLSINLHQPMRANLNKNFGSSHDLKNQETKSIERRQEKSREVKKGRAPPPPLTSQSNSRIKVKLWHVFIIQEFFLLNFSQCFRWRHLRHIQRPNHQQQKQKAKLRWVSDCLATLWLKTTRIQFEIFSHYLIASRKLNREILTNQRCQRWFHRQPNHHQCRR